MALGTKSLGRCGAYSFAGCQADLASCAIGVPGVDRDDTNASTAALEMAVADGQRSRLYTVRGEHRRGAGRLIGDSYGKVEIAARFQSGFDGSKAEAARKRVLGE